jgi:hypothetical protein
MAVARSWKPSVSTLNAPKTMPRAAISEATALSQLDKQQFDGEVGLH